MLVVTWCSSVEGEETCSLGPGWCVASWHGEFGLHNRQLDRLTNTLPDTVPGSWVGGETSGGCRNFLETFIHNPQFLVSWDDLIKPVGHGPQVTLEDVDEDDEEPLCTLIVSLMQVLP